MKEWVVAIIGVWHVLIGVGLIVAPETRLVTSVADVWLAFTDTTPWLFVCAGGSALLWLAWKKFWLLAVQQALLFGTCAAVLSVIKDGHYPDGTSGSTITHLFLLADQSGYVVIAFVHLAVWLATFKEQLK